MPPGTSRKPRPIRRLELRPGEGETDDVLALVGTLPPGRAAMSAHAHRAQEVLLTVRSGTLSALVGDRRLSVPPGGTLRIPRGTAYRLWNEGRRSVEYEGQASPAMDLDRYLQAYFQVVNAGERDRPPLPYLARVQLRHRHTQSVRLLSAPFQSALFLGAVATGMVRGRFRGRTWPGAPDACPGVPHRST